MPTEDEVIQQIKARPQGEMVLSVTDTEDLARLLDADESILAFLDGDYSDGENEEYEEYGVIFATEKRLIYTHKGILWGRHVEFFYYDRISSLQYTSGLVRGRLAIHLDGGRRAYLRNTGGDVAGFASFVRGLMEKVRGGEPASPSASADFLSDLERLASLHASGALTDEEFTAAKRKLLSLDGAQNT